ncbi:Uncharacterised protein [Pseudomonas luteola]|uniref:Uncharacterized protein n=1 Tax=Pseudomonas luteola TaxID=47886 RepID=A0A2X2DGY7_PSELU|nr:Uncharacterised protein [Pseudomonas luteola]
MTLAGLVKQEITVATEITAASVSHPRKKNKKTNAITRFSHMAGRGISNLWMNLSKQSGEGAVTLDTVDHPRSRGGIGCARSARADKGVRIEQKGQPVQAQGQRQLGKR